ncbi:hypothetical protein F5Y17DRAFT_478287 [Xylariaceae sp. FL0594]|nr:hypothetical protein F5Y17DRAFT_478287 [Xylariaceae sp. FL0594]
MAVVLSTEEMDLFPSPSLRRSHSQSKFSSGGSKGFHKSASTSRIDQLFHEKRQRLPVHCAPDPSPSSSPGSPADIPDTPDTVHVESELDPSDASTPATSLSLDGPFDDEEFIQDHDSLLLSEHADNPYFMFDDSEDFDVGMNQDESEGLYPTSPPDDTPPSVTRPASPGAGEHAEDDSAVKQHPTQHVDYLSHNWREEDIWSSWRYITTKRREFANAPRLENASWRTWMKAKYGLKTVSPETLNWLKDCDVTWLYGPLQKRETTMLDPGVGRNGTGLSRSDSFIHKKPILKKRSMSEVMLQRSISSSSLLKQAAAAVQAQQKDGNNRIPRPILHRAHTDLVTFPFSQRRRSRANTSLFPSTATSGLASPATERKHIHFDEQVQQCIAVEVKGDDDDDDVDPYWNYDDSDSDDGAIMMKTTKSSKKPIYLRKKKPSTPNSESKTIAMLPSTTLKYQDTPGSSDSASKFNARNSKTISPSSSQETLRPSKKSGGFFFGQDDDEDEEEDDEEDDEEEEDEDEEEEEEDDEMAIAPTKNSGVGNESSRPDLHRSTSTSSLEGGPAGMRRTESGMFMPYEEGGPQPNDGIIGRVIDTVNTARDIAHVIWNVGWRR